MPPSRRRRHLIAVAALPLLLPPAPAHAVATRTWNATTGGNWSDTTKWSGSTVPVGGDTASIVVTPTIASVITFNGNYTAGAGALASLTLNSSSPTLSLTFAQNTAGNNLFATNETVGSSGTATFAQSASTNSVSNTLYFGLNTGSIGTYSLSGSGTLSAPTETVGSSGTGTFNQPGGTNTVSNTLYLGYNAGSIGTYSLSGTGSLYSPSETIGSSGTGAFNQSAGNNSVSTTLTIGALSGSVGSYSFSGGSLFVLGDIRIGGSSAPGGIGNLTISGGSAFVAGTLKVWNTTPASSLSLAGGTLSLPASLDFSGDPTLFHWSGGTLRFTSVGYAIGTALPLGDTLAVPPGGTLFSDAPSSNAGTLSVGPGASLNGLGILTNTGLLSFNAAASSAPIANSPGGILLGTGTLAGTVTNSGSLQPRTGTLTLTAPFTNLAGGSILLNPGATLALTATPAPSAGTITLNGGTLDLVNHSLTNTGVIQGHGTLANTPFLVNNGSISVTGGSLTFSGSLSGTGSLYIDPSSSLNAPQGLVQSLLTSRGPVTVGAPSSLVSLSFPNPSQGSLDLAASSLTITSIPTPTLRSYLLNHQLFSTTANADPQQRLALGYTDATPTLVKLTYLGDANLDGKIDADDYALIDRGFAKHLTAGTALWTSGDFNYDGQVTSADYLLIDRVFTQQTGTLSPDLLATRQSQFGPDYVSNLISSVPEPLPLSSLLYLLPSLLLKRRRPHHQTINRTGFKTDPSATGSLSASVFPRII